MARKPDVAKIAADETDSTDAAEAEPSVSSGRRKWILIGGAVAAVVLILGLWLSGLPARLLHLEKPIQLSGPVYLKIPQIVANLNVPAGQDSYVKLQATLELANSASAKIATADMPRVVDVFQTYLRAMRPSELRGASGTYRLREALINRVQTATAPAIVKDILFQELIVQ